MLRGDIYLVEFGKSKNSFEFGKTRPVIIIQANKLNYAVQERIYNYFVVVPLSTKKDILTDEFRIKIKAKDMLKEDCYAVTNSICFLDKKYFKQKLATASEDELRQIKDALINIMELQ